MNATYQIHPLNTPFAELREASTGVRVYLGTRSQCIAFAEKFNLHVST